MKFSTLEQNTIRELCEWSIKPNVFKATRNFFKEKGLAKGTGLFAFSNEKNGRPLTILCIDIDTYKPDDYELIYNRVVFLMSFIRKLEQLGLVTITYGRYSMENEYGIAAFHDVSVMGIKRTSDISWGYSFLMSEKGASPIEVELRSDGLTFYRRDNNCSLPYHNVEVFWRFDSFGLISSNISLEQELFELLRNDFKTTDELILDTASQQLTTANNILCEANEQTQKAIEGIEQAKIQFEAAQGSSQSQFERAQEESKRQFRSANCKSIIALGLALLSIIASPFVAKFVDTTINEEQYRRIESLQTEILENIKILNLKKAENDSVQAQNTEERGRILKSVQKDKQTKPENPNQSKEN